MKTAATSDLGAMVQVCNILNKIQVSSNIIYLKSFCTWGSLGFREDKLVAYIHGWKNSWVCIWTLGVQFQNLYSMDSGYVLKSTACHPQGKTWCLQQMIYIVPTGFALQNTTNDRTIQQNSVPLSLGSPDAIFVPFKSRATKIGIMEPDN